jgi:hypothetical protein
MTANTSTFLDPAALMRIKSLKGHRRGAETCDCETASTP